MSSWWTDPTVQRDRDAFRAEQQRQEPRWAEQRAAINQLLNTVQQTVNWGNAMPTRNGMRPSNRIGVQG